MMHGSDEMEDFLLSSVIINLFINTFPLACWLPAYES